MGNKQSSNQPTLDEQMRSKYNVAPRTYSSRAHPHYISMDNESPVNTGCIKFKSGLLGSFVGAGLGAAAVWLYLQKPWENNPNPFQCINLNSHNDFDNILKQGTVLDTGIEAGNPYYTLKIIYAPTTDNRFNIVAGIPGLKNDTENNQDTLTRTDAYFGKPLGFTQNNNECLYRKGQYFAPTDPKYVSLGAHAKNAPLMYSSDVKPSVDMLNKSEKTLMEKFKDKKASLSNSKQDELNKPNKKVLAKLNLFAQQNIRDKSKQPRGGNVQNSYHKKMTYR